MKFGSLDFIKIFDGIYFPKTTFELIRFYIVLSFEPYKRLPN